MFRLANKNNKKDEKFIIIGEFDSFVPIGVMITFKGLLSIT